MSKKDKLIKRLLQRPNDFIFDEMKSRLPYLGYELKQGVAGSGIKFIKQETNEGIRFHKLHPNGALKRWLDQVIKN